MQGQKQKKSLRKMRGLGQTPTALTAKPRATGDLCEWTQASSATSSGSLGHWHHGDLQREAAVGLDSVMDVTPALCRGMQACGSHFQHSALHVGGRATCGGHLLPHTSDSPQALTCLHDTWKPCCPLLGLPCNKHAFSFFGFNLEPQGACPCPAGTKTQGPARHCADPCEMMTARGVPSRRSP